MNGIPAILLMVSMALTSVSSLFDGKKKNALILSGIGTAIAACAVAAKKETDKRKGKKKEPIEVEVEVVMSSDAPSADQTEDHVPAAPLQEEAAL